MKYKILVAEDDTDIADFIKLYLENEGYEVIPSADGMTAYEKLKESRADLAVVDIMMPKLNGYDLIRRIREDSNIPIIILSAKNLDSDKILGLDLGADDYLTKPFNPLELIARIRSNIRRYYSLGSQAEAGAKESRQIRVGDLVLDGHPDREQLHDIVVDLVIPQDLLAVGEVHNAGNGISCPTREDVARPGEGVSGQSLGSTADHGLILHGALVRAVAVEGHGVLVGRPLGVDGLGANAGNGVRRLSESPVQIPAAEIEAVPAHGGQLNSVLNV